MLTETYPDLNKVCRLCVKSEHDATVSIFANDDEEQLSIPVRIMTCAALEVKANDGLPKQICSECRYQLEKSYLFRKRCQLSDNKLRKHMRLLTMGKKSRIFSKLVDDDYDEDELEFEDSIQFLKKQDEFRKTKDIEEWKEKHREEEATELENKLKECEAKTKDKCIKELRNEVRQEVRQELRLEVTAEVCNDLRSEIMAQCRLEQISVLLDEMRQYLEEKKVELHNKSNIIQKAAQNAKILPIEKETKDKTAEMKNSHMESITTDCLNDDGDYDPQSENADNMDLPSVDGIYIINDHLDLTKTATLKVEEIPISINETLHANNIQLNADDNRNRHITAYKIRNNGDIQKLTSSTTKEPEADSNMVLLDFGDDEDVELINLSEKGYFLRNKRSPSDTTTFAPPEEQRTQDTLINDNTTNSFIKLNSETYNLDMTTTPSRRPSETVKTFSCTECPIKFSTETAFKRHKRIHEKVLARGIHYQCPVCKLYLSCSNSLKRHMVLHTGERPYACEECGKTFVQREILKRHMSIHTGIRPFECQHCQQRFAQKINLQTHINKIHSAKPNLYRCHLCPKKFTHRSGLSRHLTTHSGVVYQCKNCDRQFIDRSSIKRHVMKVHNISEKLEDNFVSMRTEKEN